MLKHAVKDSTAWKGEELIKDPSWVHVLTKDEVTEVESALQSVMNKGLNFEQVQSKNFELPILGKRLIEIQSKIDNYRGIFLIRGFPVQKYSIKDLEKMYFGVASYIGKMIVQDTKGTLIDYVADRGLNYESIAVRGYTTNAELTPHCDSGDVLGLLCVRTAKSGGMNTLTSSMSIYNEILKNHPEYLDVLYNGYHFNIRGNGPPGEFVDVTKHRVPLYSYYKGKLSCRYNQKAILTAEELPGVPKLSQLEKDAVDYMAEVAMNPELRFDITLKSGEMLLLNNHAVFHTRESFIDDEDPEKKRLLLRIWINMPHARKLETKFADHYNTGPKQGPHTHAAPVGERNR